ncbi:MAG: hypothetical protein R3E39_18850 [Anaerolineae bacterium]
MQLKLMLQVGSGLLYLVIQVIWLFIFFRRIDPFLRQRIGTYLGVTIRAEGKGIWKVVEANQGCRGLLIEMLQIVILLPSVLLPLVVFVVILMLLTSG